MTVFSHVEPIVVEASSHLKGVMALLTRVIIIMKGGETFQERVFENRESQSSILDTFSEVKESWNGMWRVSNLLSTTKPDTFEV